MSALSPSNCFGAVVDNNQSPIFVGGTGRSGSTIVGHLLDHHPDVTLTRPMEVRFIAGNDGFIDALVKADTKRGKKAAELATLTDPVKFAFAVAKLEKELKVTNRRAAPAPERIVQGTGRVSGAVDSTLERLRDEAARTGNMTKVLQYKRQKQTASRN